MFKILIVEDDTTKLKFVMQIIESIDGIVPDLIDHEIDSFSAKKKLRDNFYDLLIVDIAIPLRKSESPSLTEGINLVKEILHRDGYQIPTHIVGLTALDHVFEQATSEFGNSIISVIRYSNTDTEWENKLKSGLIQMIGAKKSLTSTNLDYDYDIAIITAVEIEFNAVKKLSQQWNRVYLTNDSSVYWETNFSSVTKSYRVVLTCLPQMGMNASSVLSMKMIHNFRPQFIFMPGIAASIKNQTTHGYGDILVIDESWDGGAGKIVEDENGHNQFQPIALHLRLDNSISEKMRALKSNQALLRKIKDDFTGGSVPNTELNIHIGSVVSVAGVVANSEISKVLSSKDRKLLGLEMEAYGMYFAANHCGNPKPKALALKSVCDYADTLKNDVFQSYAAYTSAQVLYHFIISEL